MRLFLFALNKLLFILSGKWLATRKPKGLSVIKEGRKLFFAFNGNRLTNIGVESRAALLFVAPAVSNLMLMHGYPKPQESELRKLKDEIIANSRLPGYPTFEDAQFIERIIGKGMRLTREDLGLPHSLGRT